MLLTWPWPTVPRDDPDLQVPRDVPNLTLPGRYSVMAGTPQKMLEHLLETRFSGSSEARAEITISDLFLDDFLLTHVVFFPFKELTEELINKYPFRTQ